MSCELAPRRRGLMGWLLLPLIAVLAGFYLHVFSLIAAPDIDEAYRRAYLTAEFVVYPASDGWKPGDGLDYVAGTLADLRQIETRTWIARFDWLRFDRPSVSLMGFSGRLYLHLIGSPNAAGRAHRLRMSFTCRFPPRHASRLVVSVNGQDIMGGDCRSGALLLEGLVPAGGFGAQRYDTIKIHRVDGSMFERLATRFGFRADAVQLDWFVVDVE